MITNNGNGKHANNGHGAAQKLSRISPPPPPRPRVKFDQPVILQQSPLWSRAMLWVFMGATATAIIWACVAQIEEAIPATGKLEPQGTVKEVQAPVDGVVKAIYVSDGQRVKQGERLLSLDPTAAMAQNASSKRFVPP